MTRDAIAAEDILKRAHAVGQYYGFAPFGASAFGRRGSRSRIPYPPELALDALDPVAAIVAAFLKQVCEARLAPQLRQPLFLWHTNIAPGRPAPRQAVVQFHAIGADGAIADAVVIRAARALAGDLFKEEPEVHLNSLGDKETRARFARELGLFFKKRGALPGGGGLPEECLVCAKRDVFEAADLAIAQACGQDLPSPTDQLSDQSRKRFEELLEYLEMTETPYTLAPELISKGTIWSEACFELRLARRATPEGLSGTVVGWGSRYGELARMFFKIPTPAAGVVLRLPTLVSKVVPIKSRHKVRIAFIHIGDEAKRESIKLADLLRRAHIPLAQIIGAETLADQMRLVELTNPPYLLIMGRKEALEHSATLRNRATHEETSIPIGDLARRLKAFA